jgi:hypothetical protein
MFGKRHRTGFVLFFPEPIWNEERQVVRFLAVNAEAVPCAITRGALELLGGQSGLSPESCVRVYRRNVVGIETMVLRKLASRGCRSTAEVLIGEGDVRTRIAQEALPTLSDALRNDLARDDAVADSSGRADQAS